MSHAGNEVRKAGNEEAGAVRVTAADAEDLYRAYRTLDGVGGDTSAALFARSYLCAPLRMAPRGPMLEIGAGAGGTLRALTALGFSDVRGVDSSASQVEEAERLGSAVELLDGAESLRRSPSASLSAVVALDVFEHLSDDEVLEWVGLCSDRLLPGGLLMLRVPNGEGLFGNAIRYGDLTHRRAFTARSLRQVFDLRGLEPLMIRGCRPIVHGVPSALRAGVWIIAELLLRLTSFAESGRADLIPTRNVFAVARRPYDRTARGGA